MRAPHRLSILLIPVTLLAACGVDRASSPSPPRQPAFATSTCELGVSDALATSAIDALIADITELETAGTLTSGQANALRGHLENALRQLAAGRYCSALAQLEAFRDQVRNFEVEGILTSDDASELTGDATQVIVGPPNLVTVNQPSPAAGSYDAGYAAFAPQPTVSGVSGAIVLVDDGSVNPTLGCLPLVGFPAGAIALISRGICEFDVKAQNAQNAGAVAVIIFNNVAGDLPMNLGGDATTITIPTVSVTSTAGAIIRAGLPATGTVSRKP